ncbi:MAG: hypothetical protein ACFB5Z_02845 [Elainellaceae cyanobacterium]
MTQATHRQRRYLALSLAAPLYYGVVTLCYVFGHGFTVQDDMRQHVVWFQQFVEPALFQGDAIAQYFRSVAPPGVTAVYWLGAKVGLEPLLLAKLLPLPLALAATVFLFYTTLAIAPVPRAAWLATLIFNQHLWLNDDLVSATPRAFAYPLFAAFLYGLVRHSHGVIVLSVALLGLCFPQMLLVAVGMLLVRLLVCPLAWPLKPPSIWRSWRGFTRGHHRWRAALLGGGVAIAVVLPFAMSLSDYGPAVTAAQMRSLPEYGLGGRNEYFGVSPLVFWLHGSSGLRIPVFPSVIWAGFALPLVLRQRSSTAAQTVTPQVGLLRDLMVASLGLFCLAHLLLLRLHFPSRYLYHSWRFSLAIAAGVVLAVVIEKVEAWQTKKSKAFPLPERGLRGVRQSSRAIAKTLLSLAAIVLIGIPMLPPLMLAFQGWVVGEIPAVYRYLKTQPADVQVASIAPEGNNIPVFAHRSAWIGREFSLPHHPRYYAIVRRRTAELLQALYSPNPANLRQWRDQTGVEFLLLENLTFEPNYLQQDWLINSSLRSQIAAIAAQLEQGTTPAIAPALPRCSVVAEADYSLVDTSCLSQWLSAVSSGPRTP